LRHVRLTSRSPAWRPLDSRFTQLEARLLRHKIWLEGELGKSALDYATIAQHRRDYIEFLDKQAEDGEDNKDSDLIEQRMAKRSGLTLYLLREESFANSAKKCEEWIGLEYGLRVGALTETYMNIVLDSGIQTPALGS